MLVKKSPRDAGFFIGSVFLNFLQISITPYLRRRMDVFWGEKSSGDVQNCAAGMCDRFFLWSGH
jgi:hypothetical protein